MRWVLLKHASLTCAVVVAMATIVSVSLGAPSDGLATLIGGALASLDFLAIVWIVSDLLDTSEDARSKLGLVVLLLGKLGFVGALLYAAIVRFGMTGLGIPFGIAAAVAGFTWGMLRGTSSPEGRAAMAAEERRLAAEENRDA